MSFTTAFSRKSVLHPQAGGAQKSETPDLPRWRLDDLYSGLDSPQYAADLEAAARECRAFASAYRGALAGLLGGPDAAQKLFDAIARYEAIDDLITKIMSYRRPVLCRGHGRSGRGRNSMATRRRRSPPPRPSCCSSSSNSTGSTTRALEQALGQQPLAHYRPWIEDLRKEKPFQLDDRIEQLFHEKSVTGHAAWNRLFDETIASLRFNVDGQELTLEPVLNLFQDPDPAMREKASDAIGVTLKANLRVFSLISNVLAKDKDISDQWRGFKDVAQSRHLSNRVEPEVVEAMVAAVRAAYPRLSHRYYRLKARWFGQDRLKHWDRNAPLPDAPQKTYDWAQARAAVLDAYGKFSPRMAEIAQTLLRQELDRRAGAARQGARRLRPSDLDLGPSLCPAQLPGQAARRDDAGP